MAVPASEPIADRSLIRQLLQPAAIALAFLLLALLLRSQWDALTSLDWHLQPGWLALSGACIIGGWLVEVALWRRLVVTFGGQIGYFRALQLWFASAIVRYIPGNIWQPLNLLARCRTEGIRAETTIASLTLFHVIQILAVVPIAAVYLATWGATSALAVWTTTYSLWWAIPLAVPVVVFVVWPHSLIVLANSLLGLAGRDPLPLDLTTLELVTLLGISLAGWLLFSSGFTALALGLLTEGEAVGHWLPHLMAAYPVAFAIGFLSLITPSGLAVREGAIFVLLSPVVGGAHALVFALGMRVWEIVLDAVVAMAAILSLTRPS
jgi:glycosyltransferase 2 family protein